jgi:hypothetical protein
MVYVAKIVCFSSNWIYLYYSSESFAKFIYYVLLQLYLWAETHITLEDRLA